jgi:hypothetical protein
MASGHIISPFGLILVREPIGACDLCEVPFYSHRDLRAHFQTPGHREQAQAAIEAEQARKKRLALIYESTDPEVEEHLLKVGKKMRAEGRWTVKPSERAGFS